MSRRRYSRSSHREPPEINITAFMNLMVVLIPFLLLTAAFNQLTVLDLYLPNTGAADEEQVRDNKPELQLVVRTDSLILSDRKRKGDYLNLSADADGFDYPALQRKLLQLKLAAPEQTQITLLAEPDIPYNRIIALMDRIRTTRRQQGGEWVNVELFPDIALGDAPKLKGDKSS